MNVSLKYADGLSLCFRIRCTIVPIAKSKNFVTTDVSAIGLKSFITGHGFLGTGVIIDFFHSRWTVCVCQRRVEKDTQLNATGPTDFYYVAGIPGADLALVKMLSS